MIDKIHCQFKVGNDIHKPLIAMFQAIQNGWDFPMHISEEEYIHVRDNKTKFSSTALDNLPAFHLLPWHKNFDQFQIQMYFSQVLQQLATSYRYHNRDQ